MMNRNFECARQDPGNVEFDPEFPVIENAVSENQEEEDIYFYHTDHLGSSSWITYTDGSVTQHMQNLPFGEPFIDQRATSYDIRYKFTGKEMDSETGYQYFGARYYNSDISVWLSVDPMSDEYLSTSPYAYVLNNPVLFFDPDGEDVWIFTVKTTKDYSGHTLIGVTEYDKHGNETGNVLIYELYPLNEGQVRSPGVVDVHSVKLDEINKWAENHSDVYLQLNTSKEEDEKVNNTLVSIKKNVDKGNLTYDAATFNCTSLAVIPLRAAKISNNENLSEEKIKVTILNFSVHSPNKLWNDLLKSDRKIYDSNNSQMLDIGKAQEYIENHMEINEGDENLNNN